MANAGSVENLMYSKKGKRGKCKIEIQALITNAWDQDSRGIDHCFSP